MKNIILALLVALPLWAHSDPAVSPTDQSQLFIYPNEFYGGDGFSQIARGVSVDSTAWINKATGTSVTALVLSPTTGVSFTAQIVMPQNLRERPGNVKFYAITHLSAATNTARLRLDVQKLQRMPTTNSLGVPVQITSTTVYTGFNSADVITPAASAFVNVLMPLSNAAAALLFRKNEIVNCSFQRISGSASYMELVAVKVEYDFDYSIPR